MSSSRARPLTLNALLSAPLLEITRAFAAEFGHEARSPRHSAAALLSTYSNAFSKLRDGPLDERELRARARISKRALYFLVDQARRSGWIAMGERQRVALTDAGRLLTDSCSIQLANAESSFRARIGDPLHVELRDSMKVLVRKLDLELPHYPVGYGPADASITGGGARFGRVATSFDHQIEQRHRDRWESEAGSRLDVRHVGDDWRPVARGDDDTVSDLSLTALLSQALVAFTIDYEGIGGLALPYVADLMRHIGDGPIEIKVRPARGSSASGEIPVHWAFAGLKRHAFAIVETDAADRRLGRLRLSAKGRQVRDAYEEVAAGIERRWQERYGDGTMGSVRRSLESVQPPVERGPHHVLSLTTRLVDIDFSPPGILTT